MMLSEHFPQNGPLHFQANNIPGLKLVVLSKGLEMPVIEPTTPGLQCM